MASDEIPLNAEKRKLSHTKWAEKYPRVERDVCVTNPTRDISPKYETGPDLAKAGMKKMKTIFDNFFTKTDFSNQFTIRKILSEIYGPPDTLGYLGVDVDAGRTAYWPANWGFLLRINPRLLVDIRTYEMANLIRLSLWLDDNPISDIGDDNADLTEQERKSLADFFKDLGKCLYENRTIFREKEFLDKSQMGFLEINKFFQYMKSADVLINLEKMDINIDQKESFCIVHQQSVLRSSCAIFLLIAMEALINIIYYHWIQEDYKEEWFAKYTLKSDLQFRIKMMHVFCREFTKPVSYDKIRYQRINGFRNNLFHGNINSKDRFHLVKDDGFVSTYAPLFEFRGVVAKKIRGNKTRG